MELVSVPRILVLDERSIASFRNISLKKEMENA
jgi:hypothetical protein